MAARDHTHLTLKCPKCGKTGTAEVSTADHPYMRTDEFKVESLPDGFIVTRHSKWQCETQFACTDCMVPFP